MHTKITKSSQATRNKVHEFYIGSDFIPIPKDLFTLQKNTSVEEIKASFKQVLKSITLTSFVDEEKVYQIEPGGGIRYDIEKESTKKDFFHKDINMDLYNVAKLNFDFGSSGSENGRVPGANSKKAIPPDSETCLKNYEPPLYLKIKLAHHSLNEQTIQAIQNTQNNAEEFYNFLTDNFTIKAHELYFCSGYKSIALPSEDLKKELQQKNSIQSWEELTPSLPPNINLATLTIDSIEDICRIEKDKSEYYKHAFVFQIQIAPTANLDSLVDKYFPSDESDAPATDYTAIQTIGVSAAILGGLYLLYTKLHTKKASNRKKNT
ncbi:MAG: hypothetical protein AAF380_01455 [Bacteroidota bacterium]